MGNVKAGQLLRISKICCGIYSGASIAIQSCIGILDAGDLVIVLTDNDGPGSSPRRAVHVVSRHGVGYVLTTVLGDER